MEKDTRELLHELTAAKNVADFLHDNRQNLREVSLSEYLKELLQRKNLSQKEVIRASGIDHSYACHIFAGDKNPSRPKLLAIALAMKLTADEAQYLLRYANLPKLYPRIPWDSVIIHALNRQKSVIDTNMLLDELQQPPLLT